MEKEGKEWLTISQVAKEIGVSQPTARKLIDRGELAAYRIGVRRLVRREDLGKFLLERKIFSNSSRNLSNPV